MSTPEAAEDVAVPDRLEEKTFSSGPTVVESATKKNFRRKVDYAALHKDALPLAIYPLPTFHPTNPISLLALVWTYLKQTVSPPQSHPKSKYAGYISIETRSVHVTDPLHVRALWERGFFGKGILSRSEPNWLAGEKAKLEAGARGVRTAEENTKARREERRLFKLERARAEAEKIELQRAIEQGATADEQARLTAVTSELTLSEQDDASADHNNLNDALVINDTMSRAADGQDEINDQEHLQLTLEEAFFLAHGLGVLDIRSNEHTTANDQELFDIFRTTANVNPSPKGMDDNFILNYVVYHHFRSLGWVVRPGVKFSVDYLLYYRGPALAHAEFAILIMPSYSHPFWSSDEGKKLKKRDDQRDWWWFHCISRVQSQVKKTLALCYVDIPPPPPNHEQMAVKDFLARYKVREFILRRWLMNRSRD